ncbi:MAG: putative glycoside hydrolase [Opitutales bacterium]
MKKLIKTLFLFILTALLAGSSFASTQEQDKSYFPEFSWDRVPVCIHLCKRRDNFTEDEAKFLARFPVICIEKQQALFKYKTIERGTEIAAAQIKKYNENSKILFYWNSRIDYGSLYNTGFILRQNPDWTLKDLDGEFVTVPWGNIRIYDMTKEEVRSWWLAKAKEYANMPNIDGFFVDATIQYIANIKTQEARFGKEKTKELVASLDILLEELRKQNPNKFTITNSLHGRTKVIEDMGVSVYKHTDGSMIEHFCDLMGRDKDAIVNDISLIQDAAKRGKSVVVKGWPSFNFTKRKTYEHRPYEDLVAQAKEEIVFPLAAYLVAAGEYSYFCYSWGYNASDGGMVDYDEYNKPLGKPLAEATKDGYIYTREFEHASVWVDVENRQGKIDWKN